MDIVGIDISKARFDAALLVGVRVRHAVFSNAEAGFAPATVAASIAAHVAWLDEQIEAVRDAGRGLVAADPALARTLVLLRTITGFGEIPATLLLAELPDVEPRGSPDIAEFTPKALAAFKLSPSRRDPSPKEPAARRLEGEHSSGSSIRRPSPLGDPTAEPPEGRISHVGNERLRSTLTMCALSASRTNKALLGCVGRLKAAGKPPKIILVAVARKLLVHAHAVVRTQTPFTSSPDAPSPARP